MQLRSRVEDRQRECAGNCFSWGCSGEVKGLVGQGHFVCCDLVTHESMLSIWLGHIPPPISI